jgi:hypothetical protein
LEGATKIAKEFFRIREKEREAAKEEQLKKRKKKMKKKRNSNRKKKLAKHIRKCNACSKNRKKNRRIDANDVRVDVAEASKKSVCALGEVIRFLCYPYYLFVSII